MGERYIGPYKVETGGQYCGKQEYDIRHTGNGIVVRCTDRVLLDHIVDLLNEEVHSKDVHR